MSPNGTASGRAGRDAGQSTSSIIATRPIAVRVESSAAGVVSLARVAPLAWRMVSATCTSRNRPIPAGRSARTSAGSEWAKLEAPRSRSPARMTANVTPRRRASRRWTPGLARLTALIAIAAHDAEVRTSSVFAASCSEARSPGAASPPAKKQAHSSAVAAAAKRITNTVRTRARFGFIVSKVTGNRTTVAAVYVLDVQPPRAALWQSPRGPRPARFSSACARGRWAMPSAASAW